MSTTDTSINLSLSNLTPTEYAAVINAITIRPGLSMTVDFEAADEAPLLTRPRQDPPVVTAQVLAGMLIALGDGQSMVIDAAPALVGAARSAIVSTIPVGSIRHDGPDSLSLRSGGRLVAGPPILWPQTIDVLVRVALDGASMISHLYETTGHNVDSIVTFNLYT
jgi:hypothetical protein